MASLGNKRRELEFSFVGSQQNLALGDDQFPSIDSGRLQFRAPMRLSREIVAA